MFNRVHTIQESIDKFEKENMGKATSRKAEYQLTHSMGYNKVSTGSLRHTSEELKNNSRRQSMISNASALLDPN